jgi:GNAT superfamily N-acetyltransferase
MPASVHQGYMPGAIGRIAELHARYYSENWDFGLYFEAKVACELSEFLRHFDQRRDGFWTLRSAQRVEGAVAVDGARADAEGAHLRWFIISGACRGRGFGRRLLDEAVAFCRRRRYGRTYLWTFEGLHAARHLYETAGFVCVQQHEGTQWGSPVMEQKFELIL